MTTLEKLKQVQEALLCLLDDPESLPIGHPRAGFADARDLAKEAVADILYIMDEIKETEENERDYRANYHRIMGLLQASNGEHGLCRPRWRKACSVCNARDTIDYLLREYKGAEIVRSRNDTEKA